MTNLYCIRHLPTQWNIEGRLQGSMDIPILVELSIETKLAIRNNLEQLPQNSLVITSEYSRTQQTAIAYGFKQFNIEPLSNEFDFGKYEGLSKKIFTQDYGEEWINFPRKISLGESIDSLEMRIIRFLDKYKNKENLILFGHGAFLRGLYAIVNYGTIDKMNQITITNNSLIKLNIC